MKRSQRDFAPGQGLTKERLGKLWVGPKHFLDKEEKVRRKRLGTNSQKKSWEVPTGGKIPGGGGVA